ncbi:MAG: PEP-CTERM system histidine kinase PrsK [Novosphingobium sp.]|jgi:putative PEP-CTERM system histidine kinase|nr:PEP-CTERM system histidine kinase PrsK [Novosphingobium sp.]
MSASIGVWSVMAALAWGTGAFAALVAAGRMQASSGRFGPARLALVMALGVTGLWALVGALTGPGSIATELADSLRNLAWLFAIYRMFAIDGRHTSLVPVRPLLAVLACVETLQMGVEVALAVGVYGTVLTQIAFHSLTLLRLLVATGGLMLVHNLYGGAAAEARLGLRWPALALATMWGFDLNLYTVSYLIAATPDGLAALRGAVALAIGLLLVIGMRRGSEMLRFNPSRAVMFQSASLMIVGAYLVFMVVIARWLAWVGQEVAAELQLMFAGAVAVVLAGFASSRVMRARLRVTLAKHLFQHRYDYREEWLRFTLTMGRGGTGGAALHERVIRAVADMTDSPAGLLLTATDSGELALAARWQWPTADVPGTALGIAAVRAFEADRSGGFIVDLDELRSPDAPDRTDWAAPQLATPDWLLAEPRAWALVPLHHFERLVGMVVLARPPLGRRLDWEDFDLLRVAGQQLASYLAEQAGQEALAEASRFDDFNRRIAFVMHDIKNLASQLGLLARNAEAHAENPEFRADMLVTLRNAADKLNALLARLSRYGTTSVDSPVPVAADQVAQRVVAQFRASSRVELVKSEPCLVSGRDELLEQVLVHLVQNAIDASPADSPVFVQVVSDGLNGLIEVIDSGSGMSAEFVRTGLFKPFVSTKSGGFGIGAYEARELVRAMGGRLDVESREGLGSRFSIRLPLAEAAAALRNFNSKVA